MRMEEVTEVIKGHTEVNKNKIVKYGGKNNIFMGRREWNEVCKSFSHV